MKILLAPLQRLANLIEEQNEKISEMHGVLTVDLVQASKTSTQELATQTELLTDIKALLLLGLKQEELKEKEKRSGGFKMKMPKMGGLKDVGLAVISMVAAIVIATTLLSTVEPVNIFTLLSALAVAGIIMLLAPVYIKIAQSLNKVKGTALLAASISIPIIAWSIVKAAKIFSNGFAEGASYDPASLPNPYWSLQAGLAMILFSGAFMLVAKGLQGGNIGTLIMASIALPVIALGIIGVAAIFAKFPVEKWVAPPLDWIAQTGLAILIFTAPFALILTALMRKVSMKEIGLAALSIPLIALSIVGVAWIFAYLESVKKWVAPPRKWTEEAGLAIGLFAIPFAVIALISNKVSFGGIIKAALSIPFIAGGILATAWIFSYLPEEFKAPPIDWAVAAGLAITIFAVPFAIVGALSTAITPLGIVMGALGIILIAGAMWVVAWIFSKMPDLKSIAANFTDAIMYPINAMIDALVRVKNEIGIENLLPLAGGLFAVAGGWLALVAALAGQAAGGLFSSVANLGSSIIDGIGSLFGGGKKTKTPIELLDMLIGRTDGIIALADPIKTIGTEFAIVAANTNAVIKGMGAVLQLAEYNEELTTSGTAMTAIASAYKTIADATVIMNVPALEASARMFEAIARIAENDGEDAITVLARELMEAVDKLSSTVKDLEDTTSAQSNGFKDAISGAFAEFKKTITGAAKEDGTSEAGLVDMTAVITAIQDLEARFDRPIPVNDANAFPS